MNYKKIILLLTPIFLLGFAIYWVANHSFIEITVAQGNSGFSYNIKNQGDLAIDAGVVKGQKYRKLVPRGDYEITVSKGDESYFSVVRTGWFLSTSEVSATMQAERKRNFVADNPSPCMNKLADKLLSYACNGAYTNVKIHMPPKNNTPGYIKEPEVSEAGIIEGFIDLRNDTYVLLNTGQRHTLSKIEQDGTLATPTQLNQLSQQARYSIARYNDGFIVYSLDPTSMYYFPSVGSQPEEITIPEPKNDEYSLYSFDTSNGVNLFGYSIPEASEDINLDEHESAEGGSEFTVVSNDTQHSYKFSKRYTAAQLCKEDLLCLTHGDRLEIFKLVDGKAQHEFNVTGVKSLHVNEDSLRIARLNDIVYLDLADREGYIHYSLGDYTYCGSNFKETYYLLCVFDSGRKYALEISENQKNIDSIDKKILRVENSPLVNNISVYKNKLYVSPNLGEVKYIKELGGYGYSEEAIQESQRAIVRLLQENGIDTEQYKIINPYL